jgi:hypothetical protein
MLLSLVVMSCCDDIVDDNLTKQASYSESIRRVLDHVQVRSTFFFSYSAVSYSSVFVA